MVKPFATSLIDLKETRKIIPLKISAVAKNVSKEISVFPKY